MAAKLAVLAFKIGVADRVVYNMVGRKNAF